MIKNDIKEFCATDPDSKVMKNHSNIEPCYNVQSVVDIIKFILPILVLIVRI